jgi:hypothetical protein
MISKKTTTPVTVRLDDHCITELRKKINGKKSFNSLVHEILDKYVEYYQYLEKFEPITITKNSFKTILTMLDSKQIIELANTVAKKEAVEFIHFRYGGINLDNVLMFMKMFFENCGYGYYIKEMENGLYIFKIRHSMGKSGSLYIKTVIETLFHETNLSTPEFTSSPDSLVVKIHS